MTAMRTESELFGELTNFAIRILAKVSELKSAVPAKGIGFGNFGIIAVGADISFHLVLSSQYWDKNIITQTAFLTQE